MDNISIKLYIGEEAFTLLENEDFQQEWDALHANCPWATVFQVRTFTSSWYLVYQKKYLPIIVTEVRDGRLVGLLTLAKKGRIIRSAGADLAEYCVWLTEAHNQESFIQTALTVVKKRFPRAPIYFKFIPETVPLNWIKESRWKNYCVLKSFKQPLLKVDADWCNAKLNKRSRKQDLKRLYKLGNLSFEHIINYEQFASILNELIVLYDFRKGAIYNSTQFQHDPLRKEFLLNMFKEQLLYVTVLKSNNTIIAGDINYINKKQICLKGLNCHAPAYAKHSPGVFSLYFLNGHLATQGFEEIDITPGGELYKNQLATHYGQVYVLTVGSRYRRISNTVSSGISHLFKTSIGKIASKADIEYSQLKKIRWKVMFLLDELKNIEKQNLASLLKSWVTKTIMVKKARRYISHLDVASVMPETFAPLHKNNLNDLLAFDARGSLKSRWQFLRDAMKRLEDGETVYSWCKDGRLMGCVWLRKQQVNENGGLQLEGFYFHPKSQSNMLTFLKAVITFIAQEQNPNPLYAVDTSADMVLHQVLTEAGFKIAI